MSESKESKGNWGPLVALITIILACIAVIVVLAVMLHYAKNDDSDSMYTTTTSTTTPKPCPADTSCYTPACLRAASHTVELLNKSAASPCEDFHTFACSNFKHIYPIDPDWQAMTMVQVIYDRNMDKLRRVVEAVPSTTDPQHYESKMKNFYWSCLDHFQQTGQKGVPFLEKVVEPSGGWWVLGNWPPSGYTFQDQLEKVHVDFWTDAFFTFTVGTDELDWTKSVIEISLGGFGLNPYSYWSYWSYYVMPKYREYIEKVGRLLFRDASLTVSEADKTSRLNTFVSDALYVEDKMIHILLGSNREPNAHAIDKRLQLKELNQNSSGQVDWVSLFDHMFNTDTTLVTEDTYVVVHDQEYIYSLTQWISQLDPSNKSRILNNYMIWRMADTYARYLSCDYQHAYNDMELTETGNLENPPAYLVCLRQLHSAMSDAMGALFVKDHFVDPNRAEARKVADYVKEVIVDRLSQDSHWMSPESRRIAKQKVLDSLIKIGYPDFMVNDTALNAIYEDVTVDRKDYFGSVLSTRILFRERWIRLLQHPDDHSVWDYAVYNVVVWYYSPWKELFIPAGTLQFPFFDHTSPAYMNFGTLGSMVGRGFTHAADEFGNRFLINGSHYGEWWSNDTTEEYYDSVLPCIDDEYKAYRMGPFPEIGYPEIIVSPAYSATGLSESSGISMAFQAYQKWIADHGPEPTIPGHNFTNNQLFFLSYAQIFCSERVPTYFMIWRMKYYGWVNERIRVNGALAQVPEFQEAFQCRYDSKMVAKRRCRLY